MLTSTYEAVQFIKYKLLNEETDTLKLFKREDPVRTPVDSSLVYHMQTAAARMKTKSVKGVKKVVKRKHSTISAEEGCVKKAKH